MATITKGNPFTHSEMARTSVPGREVYGGCDWCGQPRRTLFIYGNRPMLPYSPRHFCNLDCYHAFMD